MPSSVSPKVSTCHLVELVPHVGSGVVRIDPLRFLAVCHKRRLIQALSGFFECIWLFIGDTFMLTLVCFYVFSSLVVLVKLSVLSK